MTSLQQALAEYNANQATIKGHPSIQADRPGRKPLEITVCAECGRLSGVLWLSQDRWYCGHCKNSGSGSPKQISMTGRS